ncbi:T9SS type A sorting domain-containing protein [Hymenobacter persicinus]|nr:T9SS type A sorting domain-containing protein [Hymenobacter persicinus]
MKNTYLSAGQWTKKPLMRLLMLLLLALPVFAQAQTFSVTPSDPANPQDFGSVAVGSFSAAKSYTVTGSGLTGPITVALSGTSYELSRDNVFFSGSAFDLNPDASGNISTTVYARFRPTAGAAGSVVSRTLNFTSDEAPTVTFNLTGTRAAGTPNIVVDPSSRGFDPQVVNTASAPQPVSVSATSLTAPIIVTAPAGFEVSNSGVNGGAYATTLTIPQGTGTVNTTVNIRFVPTAAQNYIGNVTFASTGATTRNVNVSGTGVLPTPVLNVTPNSLAFGTTTVGSATPSQSFTVSGSNLQNNVTITAPTGYQIRTGGNIFSTAPIVLTPTGGNLANTTIDVRFVPGQTGTFNGNVVVSTPNSGQPDVTQNVAVTGTATASSGSPVVTVNPDNLNFGTITSSGSANSQTFEVSGTDLTAPIVLTPSSPNVQIRNASAGGSFSSSPLQINPSSGTVAPQTIEVRLVALVGQGNFNERIDVTSGSATPKVVTITATNTSGATSDISVSNPDGNKYTFVTRPNTQSASQRFLVAGTNLVQPLVVQPIGPNANFFEVSSDNVNFFRSLSFTPNSSGNVTQRPVYVRFVPGVNAVTVTSTIRNSSAPAPDFDVSVTGISEPTIRLDRAIGSFPDNVVKNTQTAPVSVVLEGFLLSGNVDVMFPNDATDPVRNPQQIPLFEFSLDNGATYVKSATITPDAEGNFSRNVLVRYAPVRVGNAAQELLFRNASFNNGNYFPLTSGFGRTTGFSIAVEPTAQSTATVVRSADRTSATITFDLTNAPAGTNYGQNRLVIGSSTYATTLPTNLFPADKQNFNPGTTTAAGAYNYGTGTAIEASTNTYVVFSGANNAFTVTNLDPSLNYNFYGFEFNNDGVLNAENYLVPNNQPQNPLPVELVSFTAKLRNNTVVLNWATASEKNNRGFEVERSATGNDADFKTIITKDGKGSSTTLTKYEAIDAQPLAGVSYYRLKQVDFDGKVTKTKAIAIRATLGDVSLFPNPTQGDVTIQLPQGTTENLPVRITDLSGREVKAGRLDAAGKLNTDNLKSGTYIVIIGEGAQAVTRKLVKN